jgi:uncharacterized Zn-binding protein involved in type VI secretion
MTRPVTLTFISAAACCPNTPSPGLVISGSEDVFIENRPVGRQGDITSCPATIISRNSTIFINNRPISGVGDVAGCGVIFNGATTVFIE